MLRQLEIENIAVIEKASVSLHEGFHVFTGETGAGKSILIDAINAVLGGRIRKDLVRTGAAKATVQALFDELDPQVMQSAAQLGYPCDPGENSLLFMREFSPDGKSSCRINGRLATAAILRQLAGKLIDIHGQHDNQALLKAENHVHFIDAFGSLGEEAARFQESFARMNELKNRLNRLQMDEAEKERRIDLLTYQLGEIDEAQLTPGEDETLTAQRRMIQNYSRILQQVNEAAQALDGSDDFDGAVGLSETAAQALSSAGSFDEALQKLGEQVQGICYELQEANSQLRDYLSDFEFDDSALEEIEYRLDLIYKLKRKYGSTIEEILQFAQDCRRQLAELTNVQEETQRLERELEQANHLALRQAQELTQHRREAAHRFASQVSRELAFLDMPSAQLQVSFTFCSLSRRGDYEVEFLVSANVGEPPKPLAKIASGGEISRIMLAMKNVLADTDLVPTMIFDEVDTGVSGRAAQKIGYKLRETAHNKQVICVTHLPQVASQADCHYLIEKSVHSQRTYTQVHEIEGEARVREIARMTAGDKLTPAALENAREMLAQAVPAAKQTKEKG